MSKNDAKIVGDDLSDLNKRLTRLKNSFSTPIMGARKLQCNFISDCPWQDKINFIREAKDSGDTAFWVCALEAALKHLQRKQDLPLIDGTAAHSEKAASLSAFSQTALVGGLFASGAIYFQNRGVRKQLMRIIQLQDMVKEFEKKHLSGFYFLM